MPRKTLRLPKGSEWDNLPASKEEALKLLINRYIPEDGQLREIRRYGSRLYPDGKVEKAASRKGNRGGGTGGSRQINEELATPQGADRGAFLDAMAAANAQGMDGDHIREISRTAEGIRFKESTGRGTAEELFAAYDAVDSPLGNQAGNVQPLPPQINQQIKPAELRAMDAAIAVAGQAEDAVFDKLQWLQSMGAGVRFGFAKFNQVKNGYDLFMWGATGEAQAEELADVLPGMRPDPETDLGKRAGDYIGGLTNKLLERTRNPYNPSEIAQQ